MDRASIAASLGAATGNILMKKSLPLLALVAIASSNAAVAQNAPLRGVGLLVLEATQAPDRSGPLSNARSVLPDGADGGGGSAVGARALRGAGDRHRAPADEDATSAPDALPPRAVPQSGDPAPAAAPAPHRPNYRWQSLVPGAIK
jgi:hypothetical protein